MKVTVNGRKTPVPADFREIVEKKMVKFDKFFKDDAEAAVVISKEGKGDRVELTITSAGLFYRSEQRDETYQNALDKTLYAIERQIRKNKTRLAKRLRDGVLLKEEDPVPPLEEEGEFVVRTKTFPVKPMSCEEAILQMNLLEHDFYVFVDEDTKTVNVVYRKKNGQYGRILPE